MLSRDLFVDAEKLAEPYMHEPSYKTIYTVLLQHSSDIHEFYQLMDKFQIKDAYMKVQKIPLLKYAPPFIMLEKKWIATFLKAKSLIKKGVSEYKRAHKLLEPFSRIPEKKRMVMALIHHPEIFFESEKMIKNEHFTAYFDFVHKYNFLEKTPLHTKVEFLGESYLDRLDKAEFHWELSNMKRDADILAQFPKHKEKALLAKNKLEIIARLGEALKNEQLAEVFYLVDQYHYLHSHDGAQKIRKHYLETAKKATQHALVGDGRGAYHLLKDYWDIKECYGKVSAVMKLSFYNEMKKYYENTKVDWPASIENYLVRFGIDDDIRQVAKDVGIGDEIEALSERCTVVGLQKSVKRTSLLSAKR